MGWTVLGEWQVSVRAVVPSWEDWVTRCRFMDEAARPEEWAAQATAQGLPYHEERHIVLARPGES